MESLTRRTVSTMRCADASVTCAELIRTTSMPASKRRRTNCSSQRRSERVATILVLLLCNIG